MYVGLCMFGCVGLVVVANSCQYVRSAKNILSAKHCQRKNILSKKSAINIFLAQFENLNLYLYLYTPSHIGHSPYSPYEICHSEGLGWQAVDCLHLQNKASA